MEVHRPGRSVTHAGGRRPRPLRVESRAIIVTFIAASLLIILAHDLRDAGFATDRLKRIHELEARDAQFYEQLAQKDAQRESQRNIFIDRIRRVEAQLRGHSQELAVLRARRDVEVFTIRP